MSDTTDRRQFLKTTSAPASARPSPRWAACRRIAGAGASRPAEDPGRAADRSRAARDHRPRQPGLVAPVELPQGARTWRCARSATSCRRRWSGASPPVRRPARRSPRPTPAGRRNGGSCATATSTSCSSSRPGNCTRRCASRRCARASMRRPRCRWRRRSTSAGSWWRPPNRRGATA